MKKKNNIFERRKLKKPHRACFSIFFIFNESTNKRNEIYSTNQRRMLKRTDRKINHLVNKQQQQQQI